ncbi:MAG TPA: alkaline phosphatase family protein [Vicinamibacteria bacterium]|jgi:hypothetical protein|nr:alkaline phosphatase family protein [Vicinamibacteria bacterium]
MRRAQWLLAALAFVGVPARAAGPYQTENVVIAVMDGVSWERTFGDPEHRFIPRLWKELRPQGTLYSHFYNNGVTITKAGHSTLATGTWQKMRNRGARQTMPTIFDYLADEQNVAAEKVWVLFGKGRYAYDPTTSFPGYSNRFEPKFEIDIGESTLQNDSDVLAKLLDALKRDRPRLVFANFGATDHLAHSGHWDWHTKAVEHQDGLLTQLWEAIEADPYYKGHTTLILTNDHGYHLDGVREGFAEHGDLCEGCRHIMLLVLGPDTKKGVVVDRPAYQTDVAPTVGELLGFQTPLAQGEPLKDSFLHFVGRNRKEAVTDAGKKAVRMEELAKGNLLKHLADQALENDAKRSAPRTPSPGAAAFYWGLLSAFDKTGDARYLDCVRNWAQRQLASTGELAAYAGVVLAELSYREPDPAARDSERRAAGRIAAEVARGLSPTADWSKPEGLALRAILVASAGEATHDRQLWDKAHEFLVGSLRAMDLELANATALLPKAAGLKTGADFVPVPGKLVPTQASPQGRSNPWLLLAVSKLRSHGLPFKGEFFSDVPDLRAEVAFQTYLVAKDLSRNGELWPDVLDSAINVAAINELLRRKDPFTDIDKVTPFDILRLRPDSPHLLPPLEEIKTQVRKITAVNYNAEFGLPPYRDFDYAADLLRLHAQGPQSDLETGFFLLALDAQPRISVEPDYPSPRN